MVSRLQARLLGGFGLLLLGLGLVLGWQGKEVLDAERDRQGDALRVQTAESSRILESWVKERRENLDAIQGLVHRADHDLGDRQILGYARTLMPHARSLELRGLDGRVRRATGPPAGRLPSAEFARIAGFERPMVTDLIGPSYTSLAVGTIVPSRHGDEVLVAFYDGRAFSSLFSGLPLSEFAVAVLDGHQRYIYSSHPEVLRGSLAAPPLAELVDARGPSSRGSTEVRWDSTTYLAEAARSRLTGYKVIVGIPSSRALGHLHALVTRLWALLGLLAAMVVGMALWVNRGIVEPIMKMIRTARDVAAGNLSARAGLTGQAEVAELSEALDAMTARLESLLKNREIFWQNTPMALIWADQDCNVVECNPKAKEVLDNLEPAILTGTRNLAAIAPLGEALDAVLESNQPWTGQLEVGQGEAATFWSCLVFPVLVHAPVPVVLSVQLLDVTESVRRQKALLGEVEHKTADLMAALARERRLAHFSDAIRRSCGEAEILGVGLETLIAQWGLDRAIFEPRTPAIVARGEPAPRAADGSGDGLSAIRGAALRVPVFGPQHDRLGVLVLHKGEKAGPWAEQEVALAEAMAVQLGGEIARARLLEEKRIRTEALTRALKELQALDRAKTEFLSVISHELRTPLNVVTGYAGMLSEGAFGQLSEGARTAVDQVQGAGERLLDVINDLLDLSRLEAGALELRREPIDYEALVHDVLYEQASRAESIGIDLHREIEASLPAAWADPHRAAQVLENLVSNAIKFSKSGDRVLVRVHVDDEEIVTEVADTGPGIPEEAMPKLFSRFYQVDMSATRLHGGTGLGLAIVKGLVEAMGGRVGCMSQEGQGSTFWFTLPICKET